MNNTPNKFTTYTEALKSLIGQAISTINYCEIDYGEPAWEAPRPSFIGLWF